jgi:small subunit ribosomal protein S20
LANIKSAKKRARQAEKRRQHNRYYKVTARTYVTNARKLIEQGDFEAADSAIRDAVVALDKAAQKGIIHKNNAARRKSRLMHMFNKAKAAKASA